MKTLCSLAIILAISTWLNSLAVKKQQLRKYTGGSSETGRFEYIRIFDVDDLRSDKDYYITNIHYRRPFGRDLKGWVFDDDAGTWNVINASGNRKYLKHSTGNYLKISSSSDSRSWIGAQNSSAELTLSSGGSGICISRSNQRFLRMYYKYTFPFGQYLTNTATSCGSWEKYEFIYKNYY